MSNVIKGFRGADGPILLDYSGVANVPGAVQSIADLTATPGDHFEVETVDAAGKVATVKAVEKPGGDGAGENGATFAPDVAEDGTLSWTNDKGLDNPDPVNIKGPKGDPGKDGSTPVKGVDYFTSDEIADVAQKAAGLVKVPEGSGFSLPLLYEVTTTEEVRWIDTGNDAFVAKNIIVVALVAKATSTNTEDNPIACSIHTDLTTATQPWSNYGLMHNTSDTNALMKQYDRVARIVGIAGNNGVWSAMFSFRNEVNNTPQPMYMQLPDREILNQPIKGLIIGDAAAAAGTRVFGVGTTLKIWGC